MRNRRIGICSAVTLIILACPGSSPRGPDRSVRHPSWATARGSSAARAAFFCPPTGAISSCSGQSSTVSGALEQVLVRDLGGGAGPGLRRGRHLLGRPLRIPGARRVRAARAWPSAATAAAGSVDVDSFMYDVGGAVGLIEYRRDTWAWPYFFFGIGGVTYDLERPSVRRSTFIERRPSARTEGQVIVRVRRSRSTAHRHRRTRRGDEVRTESGCGHRPSRAARLGQRGTPAGSLRQYSPIAHRISMSSNIDDFGSTTRIDFGYVHNLRAAAGLVIQFGR